MQHMRQIVETTKMSTKGQIVIPKETRELTGSRENTIFTVLPLDRKTIVLRKVDRDEIAGQFRALRARVKDKISEAEVNAIIHKAR